MGIVVILVLSFASFLLVGKLAKITKLEIQIIYIAIGLLVGWLIGKTGYETLDGFLPKISQYNTVALLLMFFSAGFSINVEKLKKSGKLVTKMFTIPAYGETLIVTIVILLLSGVLGGNNLALGVAEAIMVAGIFASSSPANVVPVCIDMIENGYTGVNKIPSTMTLATLIDGFITVPVVFVAAFIFITEKNGGSITAMDVVQVVIYILVGLVIALVAGALIGKIETVVFKKLFVKLQTENKGKRFEYLLTLTIFFVGLLIVLSLSKIKGLKVLMQLFGILVILGIGFGVNKFDKTGASKVVGTIGNRIFYVLGMPSIFIYVGANINLAVLFKFKLLVMFLIITIVAVFVKGFLAKKVLSDSKYTSGEKKFAAICFMPKGVGLSNFSVIFAVILGTDEPVIQFMTMLAAVSIILTMSIGIHKLNKAKGTLIPQGE